LRRRYRDPAADAADVGGPQPRVRFPNSAAGAGGAAFKDRRN